MTTMPTHWIKSLFTRLPRQDVFAEMAIRRLQARVEVLEEERRSLFGLAGDHFPGVALKLSGDWADHASVALEHASGRASAWLGATPAVLMREPLLLLDPLNPGESRRLRRMWLASRRRLQPFSELVSLRSRAGELRWLQVHVMPSREGHRLVWECVALDVTALENADVAQKKALREQMVFLSQLNARLRTPLNAISGYAQLMLQGAALPSSQAPDDVLLLAPRHVSVDASHPLSPHAPLPERRRADNATSNRVVGDPSSRAGQHERGAADLSQISKSCEQLTEILDEVLDTTALTLGTVQLAQDSVSFGPWLQGLAESWRPLAVDRGLMFSVEFSNCEHAVRSDRKRLSQVLRRLFLATIEGARPSGLRLQAACQHQAERLHATVAITVDSPQVAAGLAAARVLRRSNDVLALSSPLAWAQQMARRLGGSVGHALNADGSFTLQLRISLPRLQEPVRPAAKEGVVSPGLNILVVDDSVTNRLILKRFLESCGHAVQEADNGVVAVEVVSQGAHDLVFMDIDMPEMDGCEATRAIRRLMGPSAQVPICAMTGLSFDQDRERAQASGMNHFITKPMNFRDVQNVCGLSARSRALKAFQ